MVRDWRGMRSLASGLLLEATGEDLEAWNRRVEREAPSDEKLLRIWLAQGGVTGFTQAYLVVERLGYPDDLAVTADELTDGQYADRPALRPIYEAILEAASAPGEVVVQARKTHVSLHTPLRMFARVESPAPDRIELFLRIEDAPPGGRLQPSSEHEKLPARITLKAPADLDDETRGWIEQAYAENS